MNIHKTLLTLTIGLLLAAVPAISMAAIVAVRPDVIISTPADVTLNQTESDVDIKAFDERQCFNLTSPLAVDGAVIPAGTGVSCHFMHFDPVSSNITLSGKARFDTPIIGVISISPDLTASDLVCGQGVIYPPAGTEIFRGLDPVFTNDQYVVNGRRIRVNLEVDTASDQLRVITDCGG